MKKIFLVIGFLLAFFTACDPLDFFDPLHTEIDEDDLTSYSANEITEVKENDTITIMTWNIKFGGGRIDFFFDCHGDRVLMGENEVIKNLDTLTAKIREINPDILFIQEVDIQSKRSAYINQVEWLLNNTELNYAVYASHWKADFVPSDGIGRMNSGNAILSKRNLSNSQLISLPTIDSQSAIEQYFYLHRNMLKVKMQISEEKNIYLLNTHTTAYAEDDTKKKQLDIIYKELQNLSAAGESFIIAGDFNTIPPQTQEAHQSNYPDEICEDDRFPHSDFTEQTDWMQPFYEFNSAIELSDYKNNHNKHFTFTSDKNGFWNRKLDFIFSNKAFIENSGTTHQDTKTGIPTMSISDHAPISVQYVLKQ